MLILNSTFVLICIHAQLCHAGEPKYLHHDQSEYTQTGGHNFYNPLAAFFTDFSRDNASNKDLHFTNKFSIDGLSVDSTAILISLSKSAVLELSMLHQDFINEFKEQQIAITNLKKDELKYSTEISTLKKSLFSTGPLKPTHKERTYILERLSAIRNKLSSSRPTKEYLDYHNNMQSLTNKYFNMLKYRIPAREFDLIEQYINKRYAIHKYKSDVNNSAIPNEIKLMAVLESMCNDIPNTEMAINRTQEEIWNKKFISRFNSIGLPAEDMTKLLAVLNDYRNFKHNIKLQNKFKYNEIINNAALTETQKMHRIALIQRDTTTARRDYLQRLLNSINSDYGPQLAEKIYSYADSHYRFSSNKIN